MDNVPAGVFAARLGVPFFSHLDFKLDEWVEIDDYERHPESVHL